MTLTITGSIASTDSSADSLDEFRVDVIFAQQQPLAANERQLVMLETRAANTNSIRLVSARTDAQGNFRVNIPDRTQLASDALHFVVSAPAGQRLGEVSHNIDIIIGSTDSLVIAVPTKDVRPIYLVAPRNVPEAATRRITGHVFDTAGKAVCANSQVALFARRDGAPESKETGIPILVARTDRNGYFFGEVPNTQYERAAAVIERIATEVEISLVEGFIPSKLLLPVKVPPPGEHAIAADDCDCNAIPRTPSQADIQNSPGTYSTDLGTGQCVQFNTPNRAIEEFDFYTVVRTSEPIIVGFTATGDPMAGAAAPDDTLATVAPAAAALAAAEAANAAKSAAEIKAAQAEATARRSEALAAAFEHARTSLPVDIALKDVLQARKFDFNAAVALNLVRIAINAGAVPPLAAPDIEVIANALVQAVGSLPPAIVWTNDSTVINASITAILTTAAQAPAKAAVAARAAATEAAAQLASAAAAATSSMQVAQAAEAAKAAEIAARTQALEARTQAQLELRKSRNRPLGRGVLDKDNPIDWDDTPTFYQAAEIAHGHLLHFKQVWYADGYSLGDLLYSLPLAPGQKKLISVVDWERRERTERTEGTFGNEELNAALARDRDLGEVVTGALTESSRGGSKSTSAGVGAGAGAAGNGSYQAFNFGALIGVSGGYGESNAQAWQTSARNLSSSSLQSLRDRTLQSASAVRGLRSSVVHTVSQGETMRATTEVIANHNHCHALTVQYFEVLRHLKLQHELADVQECLFVPLPMSEFDLAKALRWRQSLQTYLQRQELIGGFDAARRVKTAWSQIDSPAQRYADESIRSLAGELLLTVMIPMPPFPERPKKKPEDPADVAKEVSNAINPTDGAWGVILAIGTGGASLIAGKATEAAINVTKAASQGVHGLVDDFYSQPTPQERYEKFHAEIMPGVVEVFVDQLELWAVVGANPPLLIRGADFTLVSSYQPGIPLMVSLRGTLTGQINRGDISQLIIKSTVGVPAGCKAIVNAATIRYRTASFEHSLVDDNRINDDIDPPKVTGVFSAGGEFSIKPLSPGTGAALYTPLDAWEQRSPRKDDQRLAYELVEHLNDNLEYYHHAIWWAMDPNRRYMLLDGYYAPGAGGRSVASVVENRLIGIVGNSVVLPVARGVHLDPRFVESANGERADLLDFYKLETPVPAARVSLPTRGVFAEAVMGSCNACEEIDDSKFWRWEDSPIDEPPAIDAISTATRRAEPASVLPTPFPAPIVSIQNAPGAPDPVGVGAVLGALGKQSFADITGLAATQANAAAAYSQALDTAEKFGKEASVLAQQAAMLGAKDKALGAIDSAEREGKIDAKDAKQLRLTALKKMVGEPPVDAKAASVADQLAVIDKQEANGGVTPATIAARERVLQGLDPDDASLTNEKKATTGIISRIPSGSVEVFKSEDKSGAKTTIRTRPPTPTASFVAPPRSKFEIVFRAFIPAPAVPVFSPVNTILTSLGYIDPRDILIGFSGDGRDVGYTEGTNKYRARIIAMVSTNPQTPVLIGEPILNFGETHQWEGTQIRSVANEPWWWFEVNSGETTTMHRTLQQTPENLNITAEHDITDPDLVHIRLIISGRIAALDPIIAATAPTIDANLLLSIYEKPGHPPAFSLNGGHDGFPAYELFINGKLFHSYNPRDNPAIGPGGLYGVGNAVTISKNNQTISGVISGR